MDLGDFEQGASLPLTILGGDGNDSLFGSPTIDVIQGGAGNDLIIGGLGSDIIDGNVGNDVIYGATLGNNTTDPYPYFPSKSVGGQPELHPYPLAVPFTAIQTQPRPGIDLNKTVSVTVPVNVPANPIAYFSFDSSASPWENTGSVDLDATATAVNYDTSGLLGGAASFVDQSSVLKLGTSASDQLAVGNQWTAAAWFKGLVDSSNYNTLFRAFGNGENHQLLTQNGGNNLGVYDAASTPPFRDSQYDLNPATSAATWQHIAAVGQKRGHPLLC